MKRGRNTSRATRALSGATADGIIDVDQKAWLRSVLADGELGVCVCSCFFLILSVSPLLFVTLVLQLQGDPACEDALDQLVAGNSQPLRDLVHSGNSALRTRLATLSFDGILRSLSEGGAVPTDNDLSLLAEDLRASSIAGTGTCFFSL